MKSVRSYLIFITVIIIFLTACTALNKGQDNLIADQNKMTEEMEALVLAAVFETVVYETSVVVLLTERAPTVTNTPPPSSTPTETPLPTITATVFLDPWALQEECNTQQESCVKYTINNVKNNFWVYIKMTHLESEISGKFSVAPLTRQSITLAPGEYEVVLAGYCGENLQTLIKILDFQARRGLLFCIPASWRLEYREY